MYKQLLNSGNDSESYQDGRQSALEDVFKFLNNKIKEEDVNFARRYLVQIRNELSDKLGLTGMMKEYFYGK